MLGKGLLGAPMQHKGQSAAQHEGSVNAMLIVDDTAWLTWVTDAGLLFRTSAVHLQTTASKLYVTKSLWFVT